MLTLSLPAVTSSLVHESCKRSTRSAWRLDDEQGDEATHSGLLGILDGRRFDVEPTGSHDLALDDKELESAGVGTEDVTVHGAGSVERDFAGFLRALELAAGCEEVDRVSCGSTKGTYEGTDKQNRTTPRASWFPREGCP